jgi:hypothetical protein
VDPGPVNDNFDALGYGSTFFLYNIGSLIVGLLAIPVLIVLSYTLKLLGFCSKFASRMHLKLSKKLFWNHILSVLFESYSVLVMCVLINSKHVSFNRH